MRSLLLLLLMYPGSLATAADISWQKYNALNLNRNSASIYIEGDIIAGDAQTFRNKVLEILDKGVSINQVYIYSRGGSVPDALNIGRQIRTLEAATVGPLKNDQLGKDLVMCPRRTADENGKTIKLVHWSRNQNWRESGWKNDERCNCASACFFIWAGGVGRAGDWLGIHRPYFDKSQIAQLSLEEATQRYESLRKEVVGYLSEMSIPETIIDKMMRASSEHMAYLTKEELETLKLNFKPNEGLEELAIAKCGGYAEIEKEMAKYKPGTRCDKRCAEEINAIHARMKSITECHAKLAPDDFDRIATKYRSKYGQP